MESDGIKVKMVEVGLVLKNPSANAGDMRYRFHSWVGKIPQEEGMTTHYSILA